MLPLLIASLCITSALAIIPGDGGICEGYLSTLSAPQKTSILEEHGTRLTAKQGDTVISWDVYLEQRAQQWAKECKWRHGILKDCNGNLMGQNMFMASGSQSHPSFDIEDAVESWFTDETPYNYTKQYCDQGELCGHFTRTVYQNNMTMGCALVQCTDVEVPFQDDNLLNTNLFVCDYKPGGDWYGENVPPNALSCSECATQVEYGYVCENDICAPCTPNTHPGCKCKGKTCINGGSWNGDECVCECLVGFYGSTCEKSCVCTDTNAGCSQWSKYCSNEAYAALLTSNCPAMCGWCDIPSVCDD